MLREILLCRRSLRLYLAQIRAELPPRRAILPALPSLVPLHNRRIARYLDDDLNFIALAAVDFSFAPKVDSNVQVYRAAPNKVRCGMRFATGV